MDWLRYQNQNATRNDPLDPRLIQQLATFLPQMGITMDVFSGGQEAAGEGGSRTGSTRHDHGRSGDVFFNMGGRRLNWANESDLPIFQDIVRRGKAAGITGWGAGEGYMQPGSMHIGGGKPAIWGRGGKGANAPDWLIDAYHGGDLKPPSQYALDTSNSPVPVSEAKASGPTDPPLQAMAMAKSGATDPRADTPSSAHPVGSDLPGAAPAMPPPYNVADRPIFDLGNSAPQVAAATPPDTDGLFGGAKLGKSLGEGLGAMSASLGKMPAPMAPGPRPMAARVDAPEQPPIDPQMAGQQRQMLAMALARLNAGRLA